MRSLLIFLFIILAFNGCAPTPKEKIKDAIYESQILLTTGSCAKARSVLDEVEFQSDNANYIRAYASSYACEAGYTELGTLFSSISDLNATSLLNSLAALPSSNETAADSAVFLNLQRAITILTESSGTAQPNTTARVSKFGSNAGTDLSLQALYLILVQLGKFMAYYGEADSSGFKGGGTANCIANYTFDAQVNTDLGILPLGGCDSGSKGHADLTSPAVTDALIKTRMCYGIVLFNNLFEILSNISLSSNDSLGSLSDFKSTIEALFTAAQQAESTVPASNWSGTPAVSIVKDITGQAACEALTAEQVQRFYIFLFETTFTTT